MPANRKAIWWGTAGALLVFVITVVLASSVLTVWDKGKVPAGSSVAGIPLGGLTYQEARYRLARELPGRTGSYLAFRGAGKTCTVPCKDCHLRLDIDGSLRQCLGGSQSGLRGVLFHAVVRGKSLDYPAVFRWDNESVEKVIEQIRPVFEVAAQNARIILKNDTLEYIPHQPGRRIDEKQTLQRLEQVLHKGRLGPVEVAFMTVSPLVKLEDINEVRDVLGVYVTTFDPRQQARTTNMRLAAGAVDGTIVMPGQVFSLDETLGPRREENGYRRAPVFAANRVVRDLGGGICQVATTLYNAALQAGLEIVERRPHSRPITYVPLGQDATIVANMYDLKFRNNTGSPILLAMSLTDNQLMARIFGCQLDNGKKIRLVTERQEIQPRVEVRYRPDLPEGTRTVKQQGRKGYRVKTYRIVSQDGQDVERTLLSQDYYPPVNTIIVVGPNYPGEKK
ncbi:MAG: hypothetical protein GXX09_08435 [Syntrophomonadaceae bacterium]|nr:hypothetical protein [Syntrophomonadaceae bacterium]